MLEHTSTFELMVDVLKHSSTPDVTSRSSRALLHKKMQWFVQPARIASVKTASGEGMVIERTCTTDLIVGLRRYHTKILVTPDME